MGTHRKSHVERGTERIQEESHPVCGDAMGIPDTLLHKLSEERLISVTMMWGITRVSYRVIWGRPHVIVVACRDKNKKLNVIRKITSKGPIVSCVKNGDREKGKSESETENRVNQTAACDDKSSGELLSRSPRGYVER
ncbi:hypothetical protein KQX54_007531 [Cotesia glomerata]|uniref:Uncharacterized protein n=1 Tax=Cotesia glomerata TaxID=32391 RepID=A0AAV7IQP0_COTGL|nr:hypothetical protein KQX54_007531 [Cotesia glomerata]